MNIATVVRRFLLPGFAVTVLYGLRYKCYVSPKAEVEYTGNIKIGRQTRISSFTKIKATDGPLSGLAHKAADRCGRTYSCLLLWRRLG